MTPAEFNCKSRKRFTDRETAEKAAAGARNRARLYLVTRYCDYCKGFHLTVPQRGRGGRS